MKEWPTRVRTARAPVSAMTSGHLGRADDVVDHGDVRGIRALGDGTGDLAAGDERGDRAGAHRFSALVDDEAAVGVAVEGQPEVGAVLADGGLEVDEVLRVEGVGLVVGEVAVELEVHRDDGEREAGQARGGLEDGRDGVAAHAVAGVDDDGERADVAEVDQTAQEGGVVGEDVALVEAARGDVGVGDLAGQDALGEGADVGEAGVLADRAGAGVAHLDAVVGGGVVARGEHRAGQVEGAAGVVEAVGAREADEGDVDTAAAGTVGEGAAELGAGVAHVVGDDAGGGSVGPHDHVGEGRSQGPGDVRVELVGDGAADVVGLDDVGEGDGGHGR